MTLNLGLRYEFNQPAYADNDQIGNVFRHSETGRAPNYALAAFGGIAVIVFVMLNYSPLGR